MGQDDRTSTRASSKPARIIGALTLGTALVGGGALATRAVRRFWDGAQPVRDSVPTYATYWRQRPGGGEINLLVLGDSAAQAVGAPDPDLGWVARVERALAAASGKTVTTTNVSVSGAVSSDVVDHQLAHLDGVDPATTIAICEIGGNDVTRRNFSLELFGANMEAIARALPPGSVMTEVPYMLLWPHRGRAKVASAKVRDIAAAHGHHVAHLNTDTYASGLREIRPYLSADLFHPNEHGYAVWAESIARAVTAAWAAKSAPLENPAPERLAPENMMPENMASEK